MPDVLTNLRNTIRAGIDKMVVGTAAKEPPKVGIDVTVAIFFDGTGNNRNNVAQRLIAQHNKAHPAQKVNQMDGVTWSGSYPNNSDEDSYNGGYSNVSILENINRRRRLSRREISLYIEGIGTENDAGDALLGSAIGTGSTGIPLRVLKGIRLIGTRISKILERRQDAYIEKITIDVFGFSRGAAAARYFVSFLHDSMPLHQRFGTPKAKVEIKFAGVFDTVSSFSAGSFNNVKTLRLAMANNVTKVVHLAAGDEYRNNFSLTDITSSIGNGYELTLPGAHSDIGGGYAAVEEESREVRLDERDHYIAHGWYEPADIPILHENVYSPQTGQKLYVRSWAVGKRRLRHDYQLIPLAIMADHARQYGQMDMALLTPNGQFAKFTLPTGHPLLPIKEAIEGQVNGHGGSGRHSLTLIGDTRLGKRLALSPDQVRLLRRHFLHRSAGLGFWSDGRKGMGERRKNDVLEREIFHG
jgi:hypothetical protein